MAAVRTRALDGQNIFGVFDDTDGSIVAAGVRTDKTNFGVAKIITKATKT